MATELPRKTGRTASSAVDEAFDVYVVNEEHSVVHVVLSKNCFVKKYFKARTSHIWRKKH